MTYETWTEALAAAIDEYGNDYAEEWTSAGTLIVRFKNDPDSYNGPSVEIRETKFGSWEVIE